MPTASVSRLADQAEDVLQDRDVQGLAAVGVASAGGVVVAQMAADTVLEQFDMGVNPSSAIQYAASIGAKSVVGLAFGYLAASTGGLALIALAFMGLGSFASAGVDVIEFLLTQDPLGGSAPQVQSTQASSSAATSAAAGATRASSGGGWRAARAD